MNIDRNKIIRMVAIIALICIAVYGLTGIFKKNSMTLQEYAEQNPEIAYKESETAENLQNETTNDATDSTADQAAHNTTSQVIDNTPNEVANDTSNQTANNTSDQVTTETVSVLTGASLNGISLFEHRTTYKDGFYYEPLSDNLRRYITGVSFPAKLENTDEALAVSYEELCYVHILHYDFDGNPAEGELICNIAIAHDLVEIFYELYLNEYQLESVLLVDEFDGNDNASMEANNTSCFNYRVVEGSTSLSKHALGLAIDINPLYNPYITYNEDGSENVAPASATAYADRSASFPYKIDEKDLCYKLFKEHGFTWGGDWNNSKDYQHFQKVVIK